MVIGLEPLRDSDGNLVVVLVSVGMNNNNDDDDRIGQSGFWLLLQQTMFSFYFMSFLGTTSSYENYALFRMPNEKTQRNSRKKTGQKVNTMP